MRPILSVLALVLALGFPSARAAQDPGAPAPRLVRYGQSLREIGALARPDSATVDLEGRTWITERTTGRLRAFDGEGKEVARFALEVTPGLPREPRGIAISALGEIYVADAVEHRVVVLDGAGKHVRAIGKRGAAPGELREPRGIAIAGGKLHVVDAGNHRIAVYALDGTFERALGRRGFGDGGLLAPNDVAVDAQGRVYVADLGNQRVVRFAADGKFERAWGGLGPYSGLFHAPTGIAVHGARVFVADRDNHRVQVFDADGQPDHAWGVHAVRPREGAGKLHYPSDVALSAQGEFAVVLEDVEGRAQTFGTEGESGASPPEVDRSAAAHYEGGCDRAGNLLAILEPAGPSVSIFDMDHATPIEITRFGRSGVAAGKMLVPADVEFASDGKSVWVSEPMLHRLSQYALTYERGGVLKFDPYMAKFVRSLQLDDLPGVPATPWPTEPTALELAADGRMYVADRANGRVIVLSNTMSFETVIGAPGTGAGKFLEPTAIVVADDASKASSARIHVADARGRKVATWSYGCADGKCSSCGPSSTKHVGSVAIPSASGPGARPFGLAADGAGGLWATLEDQHALVRLDAQGRVTTTLGAGAAGGLGKREWFHPQGLARATDGSIVVVDAGNHRFQVLEPNGDFRTAWGSRLFLEPILKAK